MQTNRHVFLWIVWLTSGDTHCSMWANCLVKHCLPIPGGSPRHVTSSLHWLRISAVWRGYGCPTGQGMLTHSLCGRGKTLNLCCVMVPISSMWIHSWKQISKKITQHMNFMSADSIQLPSECDLTIVCVLLCLPYLHLFIGRSSVVCTVVNVKLHHCYGNHPLGMPTQLKGTSPPNDNIFIMGVNC